LRVELEVSRSAKGHEKYLSILKMEGFRLEVSRLSLDRLNLRVAWGVSLGDRSQRGPRRGTSADNGNGRLLFFFCKNSPW